MEAYRTDGEKLKENVLYLCELELLFGALWAGILVGVLVESTTDFMIEAFNDTKYDYLEFYTVIFGVLSTLLSIMFTAFSYVNLIITMPIHPKNFYQYMKVSVLP